VGVGSAKSSETVHASTVPDSQSTPTQQRAAQQHASLTFVAPAELCGSAEHGSSKAGSPPAREP
jgi:hypothetical protein